MGLVILPRMTAVEGRRYFFVHVMKTGGTTFRRHVDVNFPAAGAVYPDRALDGNPRDAYVMIQPLLQMSAARRAPIRAYLGHFPLIVPQLIDPGLTTLTVLRDPVDRTISYLKHCKRLNPQHRDLALEDIYEDGFLFPTLMRDHQVKIFAMTAGDRLESFMDVVDIDDERRRLAERNLESVDLVGLHERYDDFLAALTDRFRWDIREKSSFMTSAESWNVSDAFRRRIAADNPQDVAFYEFARELVLRAAGRP